MHFNALMYVPVGMCTVPVLGTGIRHEPTHENQALKNYLPVLVPNFFFNYGQLGTVIKNKVLSTLSS